MSTRVELTDEDIAALRVQAKRWAEPRRSGAIILSEAPLSHLLLRLLDAGKLGPSPEDAKPILPPVGSEDISQGMADVMSTHVHTADPEGTVATCDSCKDLVATAANVRAAKQTADAEKRESKEQGHAERLLKIATQLDRARHAIATSRWVTGPEDKVAHEVKEMTDPLILAAVIVADAVLVVEDRLDGIEDRLVEIRDRIEDHR